MKPYLIRRHGRLVIDRRKVKAEAHLDPDLPVTDRELSMRRRGLSFDVPHFDGERVDPGFRAQGVDRNAEVFGFRLALVGDCFDQLRA
jgi:hypothetical protein